MARRSRFPSDAKERPPVLDEALGLPCSPFCQFSGTHRIFQPEENGYDNMIVVSIAGI